MENRSSRSEVWRNKLTCATQIKTFFCLKKYDCTSINNRTYVLTRITDWKKKSLIASLNKIKLFFQFVEIFFFINKYVDWMFCQRKVFLRSHKKDWRRNFVVILKLWDLCIEIQQQRRQSHISSHVNNNTPLGQNLISKKFFWNEKKRNWNGMHNCTPLPLVRKAIGFLSKLFRPKTGIIKSDKRI